jgi:hypothetical protein
MMWDWLLTLLVFSPSQITVAIVVPVLALKLARNVWVYRTAEARANITTDQAEVAKRIPS